MVLQAAALLYRLLCWVPHVASYGPRASPFCALVQELLEASSDQTEAGLKPARQASRYLPASDTCSGTALIAYTTYT